MISNLLNQITAIKSMSYLELGVGNRRNFDAVLCLKKAGVDINGKGTFHGTTDEFFVTQPFRVWDIIYIDADHSIEQVVVDFNHSVKHFPKWIIVHDTYPPSEKYTHPKFCNDSYKFLYRVWSDERYSCSLLDDRYGTLFIKCPHHLIEDFPELSYFEFIEWADGLKRLSEKEMVGILNA